jgi:hypothetical protein
MLMLSRLMPHHTLAGTLVAMNGLAHMNAKVHIETQAPDMASKHTC